MTSEEIEIVAIIFDQRNAVTSGAEHIIGRGRAKTSDHISRP